MTYRRSRPTLQGRRSLDAKFHVASSAWIDVAFACGAYPLCVRLASAAPEARPRLARPGGRRTGISSRDAGLGRSGEHGTHSRGLNRASRGRGAGATVGRRGTLRKSRSEEATAIRSGGARARCERPARHRKAAPRLPRAPPRGSACHARPRPPEKPAKRAARPASGPHQNKDAENGCKRTRTSTSGTTRAGKRSRAAQAVPGMPQGRRGPKGSRPRLDVRIQSGGEGREGASRSESAARSASICPM